MVDIGVGWIEMRVIDGDFVFVGAFVFAGGGHDALIVTDPRLASRLNACLAERIRVEGKQNS